MKSLIYALAIIPVLYAPAYAEDAPTTVFEPFLSGAATECAPTADVEKLGAVVKLTPEQFNFARALYIAIPPVSRALPPGDRGELIGGPDGTAIMLLVDGDQSCARFLAPDFVLQMLNDIKAGKITHAGKPS